MVIKVKTLAEAKRVIAEFENKVEKLEGELEESSKEKRTLSATINIMNKINSYDQLLEEVKKLTRRAHDLLDYNNDQVEKRRELANELREYKALNNITEKPIFRAYVAIEKKYEKLKAKNDI